MQFLAAGVAFTQMMAVVSRDFEKLREKMFNGMQDFPIKYFDTHNHGDIMSHYTNDIDTLRQMISQSFPQLMISLIMVMTVLGLWFTTASLDGAGCCRGGSIHGTVTCAGNSAKYFIRSAGGSGQDGRICRKR